MVTIEEIGSMFSSLNNILKNNWYTNQDNKIIKFYTPNGTEEYEVFSIYEIKAETYFSTVNFISDSVYQKFLDTIKSRSIYDFNVDLTKDDQIITVSTCANNTANRIVLHAKKIQSEN